MKKLALAITVLFIFGCERSMDEIKPFKEGDQSNFRSQDNEIILLSDPGKDDDETPIVDP